MIIKDQVINSFSKGAKTYDTGATVQFEVASRLAQRLAETSAQRILEIGCGTGLYSQKVLSHFPDASFLLTDISHEMLSVCQEKLSSSPSIRFACMDGESLEESAQFDLITSSMTLHWFNDIRTSFQKIFNKLVPGGKFIFAMLGENSLKEWKIICNQFQFSVPTPRFPEKQYLSNLFPELSIESEMITHRYESIYAFLMSLKKIGATATRSEYQSLPAGKLRYLMRQLDKEIDISYEIIYGHYRK